MMDDKKAEVPRMGNEEMEKVEEILGYHFQDRSLLEEALTHSSFYRPLKPGVSYERLEFVGDAILNLLVAHWVFTMYPGLGPGSLTRLRAANVDTEKLARIAVSHDLHLFLRHKSHMVPTFDDQIKNFKEGINEYPNHSNGLLDPPKALADIVESLLGALFLDCNCSLDTVWKAFKKLAEPLIDLETLGRHPVTELYELCQKNKLDLKFVKDAWAKSTNVEVLINGNLCGSATYSHKKDTAMNRAAKSALDRLKVDGGLVNSNYMAGLEEAGGKATRGTHWTRRPSSTWFLVCLLLGVVLQLMVMFNYF